MDGFYEEAFQLLGQSVSWAEVVGDLSGLLCVWWLTRQVVWTWPAGLVNNVFFFVLFLDADLFASAVLQVAFFALGAYGWWEWARHRDGPVDVPELPVRRTTRSEWLVLGLATAVWWPAIWAFLERYTDPAAPVWDSLTVALSLVATYGQAKKLVESWAVWIIVDLIAVPLYWSQDLRLTAGLYVVFGVLSVAGLRQWRRDLTADGDRRSIRTTSEVAPR